jgi:hypothetical protein
LLSRLSEIPEIANGLLITFYPSIPISSVGEASQIDCTDREIAVEKLEWGKIQGFDRINSLELTQIDTCRKCQNKEKIIFFVVLQHPFRRRAEAAVPQVICFKSYHSRVTNCD